MTKWRAPKLSELVSKLGLTEQKAQIIRNVWHSESAEAIKVMVPVIYLQAIRNYRDVPKSPMELRCVKRYVIDQVLSGNGVQYLGASRTTKNDVHYSNSSDVYRDTLFFAKQIMWIDSMGGVIERRMCK